MEPYLVLSGLLAVSCKKISSNPLLIKLVGVEVAGYWAREKELGQVQRFDLTPDPADEGWHGNRCVTSARHGIYA